MKRIFANNHRGFTLIELLVVISILSLFSSIVYASLGNARVEASDAKKQVEVKEVSKAIGFFYEAEGRMPGQNGNPQGSNTLVGQPQPACEGTSAYEEAMGELVTKGYLSNIPESANGFPYCYFVDSSGSEAGAVFFTKLESGAYESQPKNSSCRPQFSIDETGIGYHMPTIASQCMEYIECAEAVGYNFFSVETGVNELALVGGKFLNCSFPSTYETYCKIFLAQTVCSNDIATQGYCSCTPY